MLSMPDTLMRIIVEGVGDCGSSCPAGEGGEQRRDRGRAVEAVDRLDHCAGLRRAAVAREQAAELLLDLAAAHRALVVPLGIAQRVLDRAPVGQPHGDAAGRGFGMLRGQRRVLDHADALHQGGDRRRGQRLGPERRVVDRAVGGFHHGVELTFS